MHHIGTRRADVVARVGVVGGERTTSQWRLRGPYLRLDDLHDQASSSRPTFAFDVGVDECKD